MSDRKDADAVVQLAKKNDEGERLRENRLSKAWVASPDGELSGGLLNASDDRLHVVDE